MVDTSFLVGQTPTPLLSPYEIQARRAQMANALATQQLQQQQLAAGGLELQQKRQAIADEANTRAALAKFYGGGAPTNALAPAPAMAPAPAGMSPTGSAGDLLMGSDLAPSVATAPGLQAPPAPAPAPAAAVAPTVPARPKAPSMQELIAAGVPPAAASGIVENFQKIDKNAADIDEKHQNTAKLAGELNSSITEQLGLMASSVLKSNMNPAVARFALENFASHGPEYAERAKGILTALQANPQAAPAILQQLADAGEKSRMIGAREGEVANQVRKTDAELPGLQADSLLKKLTAEGKAPVQPFQRAELNLKQSEAAETRRHNRVGEAQTAANQERLQLTPQALDQMAELFHQTGDLPNLGMGAAVAGTRSSIINRTAELYPAGGVALNKAEFAANRKSLQNVTTTLDTLSAFESAGLKNLKVFTDAAEKLPDTGVPWLNAPVRMLDERVVGSKNMAVVSAARDVALREIARVTNDPKLSGVLSDSARHEVQSLSPKDATISQILAVAKLMQNDMANVHTSLEAQRNAISARISGPAPASQAAAGGNKGAASSAPVNVQHMSTDDLLKALAK